MQRLATKHIRMVLDFLYMCVCVLAVDQTLWRANKCRKLVLLLLLLLCRLVLQVAAAIATWPLLAFQILLAHCLAAFIEPPALIYHICSYTHIGTQSATDCCAISPKPQTHIHTAVHRQTVTPPHN